MREIGLGMLALTLALGGCAGKGTQQSSASSAPSSAPAASAAAAAAAVPAMAASTSAGAKLFVTNCASCHQADGNGIPGAFPPLASNAVVTGDSAKLIHIVKYGLQGKIDVDGHPFSGMMPNWNGSLSDGQIASVLTYVRSAWGNHAAPIATAAVTAVKK